MRSVSAYAIFYLLDVLPCCKHFVMFSVIKVVKKLRNVIINCLIVLLCYPPCADLVRTSQLSDASESDRVGHGVCPWPYVRCSDPEDVLDTALPTLGLMRAYGQRRQRRHPAGSRSQLRTQRGTSDNHLRKNAASIRYVEDANGKYSCTIRLEVRCRNFVS